MASPFGGPGGGKGGGGGGGGGGGKGGGASSTYTTLQDIIDDTSLGLNPIYGTGGSDQITGTAGADIIIGVSLDEAQDLNLDTQVDILTGGKGSDYFVLGDENGCFYTNGDPSTYASGSFGDYADIKDFDNKKNGDTLVLHDNATYLEFFNGEFLELYYLGEDGGPLGHLEPVAYIRTGSGQIVQSLNDIKNLTVL